jgi:hypothetical protein
MPKRLIMAVSLLPSPSPQTGPSGFIKTDRRGRAQDQ